MRLIAFSLICAAALLFTKTALAHPGARVTPESSGSASGGIALSIAVSETVKAQAPWPSAFLKITNISNGSVSIDLDETETAMAHAFLAKCTNAHGEKRIAYDPELMSGPASVQNGQIVHTPVTLSAGQSYSLPWSILITRERLSPGESCEIKAHLLIRLRNGRTIPVDSGRATFTSL